MSSLALELRLRRVPRPTCTTLFYLQLAPIDCLMAADCNKPIWSLHLNSKCEISSLAKRRRRRPFALAPSGRVCVCVCALCVNVPSRKCQLLCLCAPSATCSSSVGPWRHKGHKPRLELQCLFLSFLLLLLLLSVRLSICLI